MKKQLFLTLALCVSMRVFANNKFPDGDQDVVNRMDHQGGHKKKHKAKPAVHSKHKKQGKDVLIADEKGGKHKSHRKHENCDKQCGKKCDKQCDKKCAKKCEKKDAACHVKKNHKKSHNKEDESVDHSERRGRFTNDEQEVKPKKHEKKHHRAHRDHKDHAGAAKKKNVKAGENKNGALNSNHGLEDDIMDSH